MICRVVVVSSTLHEKGKINFADLNLRTEIEQAKKGKGDSRNNPGYSNSKLMNAYFMRALADKLRGSGVDINACCPGFCYTNLFRYSFHTILLSDINIDRKSSLSTK